MVIKGSYVLFLLFRLSTSLFSWGLSCHISIVLLFFFLVMFLIHAQDWCIQLWTKKWDLIKIPGGKPDQWFDQWFVSARGPALVRCVDRGPRFGRRQIAHLGTWTHFLCCINLHSDHYDKKHVKYTSTNWGPIYNMFKDFWGSKI